MTGIRFLCLFVDTFNPFTLLACVIWLEGLAEVSEVGLGWRRGLFLLPLVTRDKGKGCLRGN